MNWNWKICLSSHIFRCWHHQWQQHQHHIHSTHIKQLTKNIFKTWKCWFASKCWALSIERFVVGFPQSISFETSAAYSGSPLPVENAQLNGSRQHNCECLCTVYTLLVYDIIIRFCASKKQFFHPLIIFVFGLVCDNTYLCACAKRSNKVFGESGKLYIRIYKLVVIAKCYHHYRIRIFEYKFYPVRL